MSGPLETIDWKRIDAVFQMSTSSLSELAVAAGGDPSTFYQGRDFRGARLWDVDLRGVSLARANLRGCGVCRAKFDRTTDFTGANIDRADISAIVIALEEPRDRPQAEHPFDKELSTLMRDLSSNDLSRVLDALDIIHQIGRSAQPAVPTLTKLYRAYNAEVWWRAARAIAKISSSNYEIFLDALANANEYEVRALAAQMLARVRLATASILDALVAALDDESREVAFYSALAIRSLAKKDMIYIGKLRRHSVSRSKRFKDYCKGRVSRTPFDTVAA